MLWIAEGQPIGEVAERAHVDRTSVHRWRERYLLRHDPGRWPTAHAAAAHRLHPS